MTAHPRDERPDLLPFQVGTLVAHLDQQVAAYRDLGVRAWVTTGWTDQGRYFDAERRRLVQPRVRMALGRMNDDTCVEFIDVDPAGEIPWAWDAARVGTSSHVGYWSADVAGDCRRLAAAGASLVTARADTAVVAEDDVLAALRAGEYPDALVVAYLRLGDGLLAELVSTRLWPDALRAHFGPGVLEVVPAPPT